MLRVLGTDKQANVTFTAASHYDS